MRPAAATTWIAAFIGWAAVTAAFLTVPPLRRVLPIDGAAAPGIAASILAEEDVVARIARIESLTSRDGERATAELVEVAVRATDSATRLAAVNALSRARGGIEVLADLGARPEFRLPALAALSEEKNPLAVEAILDILPACRSADERSAAFHGLARQGGFSAIHALMCFATELRADSRDRALATDAVAELRDPRAPAILLPWLEVAGPPALNEAILSVIGRLRDPGGARAIYRFFQESENPSARTAAVDALSRIGSPTAIRALAGIRATGPSPEDREAAGRALDALRTPR